jgi:D-beta-D-heptose 7-phosphate kinase/D-beta-D-heptose 1-phosphate adenosyltransferase
MLCEKALSSHLLCIAPLIWALSSRRQTLTMPPMNFREKLISLERLPAWRNELAARGQRLVVTNGCFDLLHLGHVTYLEAARNLGDALLVGVNGDDSVRGLKGQGRPLNRETERAAIVAALESVTAVCIFPEVTALQFLSIARPDIYVKGGDYNLGTINQEERRLVESMGGKVVVIGGVPGCSTTALLDKLSG